MTLQSASGGYRSDNGKRKEFIDYNFKLFECNPGLKHEGITVEEITQGTGICLCLSGHGEANDPISFDKKFIPNNINIGGLNEAFKQV
jgi:hypothetical protein